MHDSCRRLNVRIKIKEHTWHGGHWGDEVENLGGGGTLHALVPKAYAPTQGIPHSRSAFQVWYLVGGGTTPLIAAMHKKRAYNWSHELIASHTRTKYETLATRTNRFC